MPEGLAVVVDRERAQAVIDALETEGVYDRTRAVEPHGEGIAVPVTAEPDTVEGRLTTADLPARNRDLKDLLAARGWSEDELADAPASWSVLGTCVLLDDGDYPHPEEVGEALLDLHGSADTVLLHRGVSGDRREPDVAVLAGLGDTEVVHTEHGTRYAMDLSRVMFSPGNKAERALMGEVVEAGERVFDMFAGVGYFTLPMARSGAAVTAAEINPEAYRYLVENAMLNEVQERVSAFRADCRDVDATADRVVMGYYDAHEYLDTALDALEPGGVLHLHEATPEPEVFDRPVERIETAADERGRDVAVLDRRVVKTHAPGVEHVVVDARVE
ncbi:class I SAM-dependent methyltransferase [Halorarius halobius]|uniref:class I SAM-dependent methyltransferase n=1 Tax=Halorarius halobius TaxID=2962671 RepID=UPI0020CBC8E1|nr:class I SAM-dependent methyltransferase family protein [Halorarius halobius]